jgi:predicted house-cleaning noncanonical NTP pyrophosphatase (MazG superfamily)
MLSLQKSFNKPMGLVQNAQGGSVINQWFKPGKINYDSSLIRAKEAQKHGKLKAIIWHQGSSDAKDAKQDNFVSYKAKLKEMVENFRKDLNEPELPFICGELSEREDFIAFNKEVIQKVKEYIPNSDYVSSKGTSLLEDNIHFDAESADKLGNRYAEKVLLFLQKK